MPFSYRFCVSILIFVVILRADAQLSPDFYDTTCPQFSSIVQDVVMAAVANESRMGASLLRLLFHDCFVQGCDGSVLLDDTANFTGEKTAFPNINSLRGFNVIDDIKAQVERVCPGVVSCADIVAVAAREGVVALNGPSWIVPLGRRDSLTANLSQANTDLPAPFLNLSGLISAFAKKGFTSYEMVTLSGAHTIGQARCVTFRARIYNDTTIDPKYAASLQANCPITSGVGDDNLSPLDVKTPANFDKDYYQNLLFQKGLLHSDQQLLADISTSIQVAFYSFDTWAFFDDFVAAIVKMSNISVLTRTEGQIRQNCRRVNPPIQDVVMQSHDGPQLDFI